MLAFGRAPQAGDPGAARARFRQRLAELGWIDGKNFVIDTCYADGDARRLQQLAHEFVASSVDIIVASAVTATAAARQATSTIPIVMLHAGNPEGAGLIASLARPGGNVTGTSNILIGGKQVQLLREFIPRLARLAVLVNPGNAGTAPLLADLGAAARGLAVAVTVVELSRAEDLPRAFAAIRKASPDALFVMIDPVIGGLRAWNC